MAGLHSLPVEMIGMVMKDFDTKEIARLSRTSKEIRHKTLPYLYQTVSFRYNSLITEMGEKLARFLQVILKHPELANHIQEINLSLHYGYEIPSCSPGFWYDTLNEENRKFVEENLQLSGYPRYIRLLDSIKTCSFEAVLGFIVLKAKNLRRISLAEESDAPANPVIGDLLEYALTCRRSAPMNLFERVQKLAIYLNSWSARTQKFGTAIDCSQLACLTHLEMETASGDLAVLDLCLQASPNLKSLEYRLDYSGKAFHKFDGQLVGKLLRRVRNTLETLKLFVMVDYDRIDGRGALDTTGRLFPRRWLKSTIDPLLYFRSLKSVSVPLVLLVGSKMPKPFHLLDFFPSTIEFLCIADDFVGSSSFPFGDKGPLYESILEEFLDSYKTRAPKLCHFQLDSKKGVENWGYLEAPPDHLCERFEEATWDGLHAECRLWGTWEDMSVPHKSESSEDESDDPGP